MVAQCPVQTLEAKSKRIERSLSATRDPERLFMEKVEENPTAEPGENPPH